ncbi:hypothetical protein CRG98_038467, partial [Punica granatum]
HPSSAPPAPVTVASACHRARPPSSCPTPVTVPDRARARPPLHSNTLLRVPPSHPTLKHFPDSFLKRAWIVVKKTIPVRTRMWTLVGARMRAFGLRGLGVSTFPWGRVTDTRERRSRHLSFYHPKVEGG